MELSSRHILLLAAPLVVVYLTYSTMQRGITMARAVAATQAVMVGSRTMANSSGDENMRNPFSPVGAGGFVAAALRGHAEAKEGDADEEEAAPLLTLNGTAITSNWRFAIINGERIVEGQRYLGLRVEKIEPERVVLTDLDGIKTYLKLEIAKIVAPSDELASDAVDSLGGGYGLAPVSPAAPMDILKMLGIPRG